MFKEAYSYRLISYCAPLGLESRPVIATGDKRPASTVFGDHHSKQFREELINFHHHEGNIKVLNDMNFLVHFQPTPELACLWKLSGGPRYF